MAIDSSFTPLTGAAPGAIPPQSMFPGAGAGNALGASTGNMLGASIGSLMGALGNNTPPQPTQVMFGGEMTRQGGAAQPSAGAPTPDEAAQQTGAQEMQTTPAGQAEGQQGSGMDWGTLAQMLVGTGATIAGKPQILALMQYLTQLQKQAGGAEKEKPQGTSSEGTTNTPAASGQTTTQTQDPVASQEGSAPAGDGGKSAQKGPDGSGQQSEQPVPAQGVPAGMEQNPGWVGGNLQEELAKAQALLQIFAPQQMPSFQQSPLPNNAQVFNQGQV